jgi:hypothetical protein
VGTRPDGYRNVTLPRRSEPTKQLRQRCFQAFGYSFYIHERNVPHPTFHSAIVRSVKPTPLRCFLLVDPLFLTDAADRAAKANADVDRH